MLRRDDSIEAASLRRGPRNTARVEWVLRSIVTSCFGVVTAGPVQHGVGPVPVWRGELNPGSYPWRDCSLGATLPTNRMALRMIKGLILVKWGGRLAHEKITVDRKPPVGERGKMRCAIDDIGPPLSSASLEH